MAYFHADENLTYSLLRAENAYKIICYIINNNIYNINKLVQSIDT